MVCVPPTCPRRPELAEPRQSRPRVGLSLVELLVTVTLVGIALGLSLPVMTRMANQSRVQRAAQTIQAEVQQAFALAGRNRVPVRVRWNSGALQVQVTDLAGTTIYRRASVGTGGGFGLAAADVTVTPQVLTVFPNGFASDSLVVAVRKGGYSRTIRVSRSGMVRSRER